MVLTGDVVSHWDLPVRLWRHNLTLVVADGLRPWRRPSPAPGSRSRDRPAWSTSNEAGGLGTHLTPLPRRVRPHPCLSPPLLPPRPQGALAPPRTTLPALQLPPGEFCECPLEDRPGHSRKLQPLDLLSHSCNITRTLISS